MCNLRKHKQVFGKNQTNATSPFTNMKLTLIPAWICNNIHYKVWDEITYHIPKFQRCDYWSLGMDE